MLRRAPTAARPLGRARHAREQARPGAAGWTGMLALAVAAVAADQLTKTAVVHALRVGEAVDVRPGPRLLARRATRGSRSACSRAGSRSWCR